MHEAARIGYAQARVQARLGARPSEPFWRELEAGRGFGHLIDWVRTSALAGTVADVPVDLDAHALEARLRRHWSATCEEVANWYPPSSQPALRWLAWLPWLPALGWLSQGRPAPAWMQEDPVLGPIAAAEPPERTARLEEAGLAPLAHSFEAAGDLAMAWHRHWRRTWPPRQARALAGLDRTVATLHPGAEAGRGPAFDALVGGADAAALRLFRRQVCTPAAGLCLLVLLWIDQLRLRAALSAARLFGAGEAA